MADVERDAAKRAGIGNDAYAHSRRIRESDEQRRNIDHLVEAFDKDHALVRGQCRHRSEVAGESTGMRKRRRARLQGAAGMEHDDGLAAFARARSKLKEKERSTNL